MRSRIQELRAAMIARDAHCGHTTAFELLTHVLSARFHRIRVERDFLLPQSVQLCAAIYPIALELLFSVVECLRECSHSLTIQL